MRCHRTSSGSLGLGGHKPGKHFVGVLDSVDISPSDGVVPDQAPWRDLSHVADDVDRDP